MKECTIIIRDKEELDKIYGILTVEGHTHYEVFTLFVETKARLEGTWTVEDLIKSIPSDWNYTYIDNDFCEYYC